MTKPDTPIPQAGGGLAPLPHLTPEERSARGKAARQEVPRSSHGEWEPSGLRPDPIDLLERQAATRVPELVPIRYGRMASSPFAFFRGAAYVMASDLAPTPRSGIRSQLCGDAHLSNFGFFASPERSLIFDINDFDETLPGPWEWDVKRLAASLAVAGRENGLSTKERRQVTEGTVASYREAMREFAGMRNLDVWYARSDEEQILTRIRALVDSRRVATVEKNLAKMRTRDSLQVFDRLTGIVDGEPRILADPPLVVPVEDLAQQNDGYDAMEAVRQVLRAYRRSLPAERRHLLESFRLTHLARKVVGVGSVGTRAWILLLLGRDAGDPLFLQVKEAPASVLESFLPASRYDNGGQRVVIGQRLMQSASDIFLGWTRVAGVDGVRRDFYVRQLRDWKGSIDPSALKAPGLELYGRQCGWALARAHAVSGDRIAIASYLGSGTVFDKAVTDFAERYADQTEQDHAALVAAIDSGRIEAETGI